jgi:IPT/TIG domain
VVKASGGSVVLTVTGAELGADVKAFKAEKISVVVGIRTVQATYIDATRMRIFVAAAASETLPVTIIHDGIAGEPATLTLAPVVTALSATSDSVTGGRQVTVRAAGANLAEATDFRFGGNAATCVKQGTGTTLAFLCTVPPTDAPGPVQVSFTTGSGQTSRFTPAATFSYVVN